MVACANVYPMESKRLKKTFMGSFKRRKPGRKLYKFCQRSPVFQLRIWTSEISQQIMYQQYVNLFTIGAVDCTNPIYSAINVHRHHVILQRPRSLWDRTGHRFLRCAYLYRLRSVVLAGKTILVCKIYG